MEKAVIILAGRATRFLPITKTISKEMLPIVDRPNILYLIEALVENNIKKVAFVVGHHNIELLKNFFSQNKSLEEFVKNDSKKLATLHHINDLLKQIEITYIIQEHALGTAKAVELAKDFVGKDDFLMLQGDDLMEDSALVIKEMMEEYEKQPATILACERVKENEISKYGIIKLIPGSVDEIEDLVEKPSINDAPSNIATMGWYLLQNNIFEEIANMKCYDAKEYYLTNALKTLKSPKRVCFYHSHHYDLGSKAGYIKANIMEGLKTPEIAQELQDFINSIRK